MVQHRNSGRCCAKAHSIGAISATPISLRGIYVGQWAAPTHELI
jgi:hypothetical protein